MTNQPISAPLVYIGAYTQTMGHVEGKAKGIASYRMDRASGVLTLAHLTRDVVNPSYLAFAPDHRYLYAVNELTQGGVSAFAVDPATGVLAYLNQQSSHGADPAHLHVTSDGRWVLAANYTSGSVALLPIQAGGSLGTATDVVQHEGHGPNPKRQEGPHAHYVTVDPANRFVLVVDLGLDRIMIYRLDQARGKLVPGDPPWSAMPPGSGPRHLAFHPNGRCAYIIHEMDSTLSACTYDVDSGLLHPLQRISTLPADFTGTNSGAAVRVAPSGRFVYGSNRGHDSIAIFAVEPAGTLTSVDHVSTQGRNPRDFNIDPSGSLLLAANQDSDTVVAFHVDQQTGKLTPAGQVAEVMTPVCVKFSARR